MGPVDRAAATPGEAAGADDELTLACSWCGSTDVEFMAMYGPQMLADQYHCNSCKSYFGTMLQR